nr:hypothetical protein [Tanacetum cinerariifolium]
MRPFGCLVTILNTIDHLGKFDGKPDEGFFFGYSLNSKSFRVFNSRTRTVEENLHIRFSKNTPNVVGSGPDWLFDIDALARIMIYEPIVAGTQSNDYADLKSSHNDGFKYSNNDGKKVDKDPRKENECNDREKEDNVNSTNNVNTVSSTINAAGTKWVFRNKKDERGICVRYKARLVAQGHTQEERINYDEVFVPVARIKAIRLFLSYASFKDFVVYQMDVKSVFLYGKIEEEVYVCQPPGFEDLDFPDRVYKVEKALYELHQDPKASYENLSTYLLDNGFQRGKLTRPYSSKGTKVIFCWFKFMWMISSLVQQGRSYAMHLKEVKNASMLMETQKPLLKDEDGKEVDVHMYRSMIGSLMYLTSPRPNIMFVVCACAKYQVNPKVSHLYAVKRIFSYIKVQETDSVANSTTEAEYLAALSRYKRKAKKSVRLMMDKTINAEAQIHARVDGKKVIFFEASIRRDLQFAVKEGVNCLPNATIIEQFALVGQIDRLSNQKRKYVSSSHTKNFFRNMRRIEKGFSRRITPLFLTMVVQSELGKGSVMPTDPHHTPTILQSSSSQPQKTHKPRKPTRMFTTVPQPSNPMEHVADEAFYKELGDSLARAATTASSLEVEQDSGEDASKQERRIDDIDADEEITLVNVQADAEFDLGCEEVFVEQEVVVDKKKIDEVTLAQDKGKGIHVEELMKPKKKDQIRLDEEATLKLQAEFDKEQRLAREKAKKELEANIALIETWDAVQEKIDANHHLAKRLQAEEQ